MKKFEAETGKMVAALRDGLHGLHLSRMALVAESRALRLAGRKAERDKVWARVEEITAQIEVTNRELAEHMLRFENETQRRGDAEARWTELIPCPFCGGGAQHAFGMDKHWLLCTVCGACGKMETTRQHAVDAWNTRTANLPDDHNADGKDEVPAVSSTGLLDALRRAEKTMKDRAYTDYERYNPLDYDKCLIWVEATMREVRKEIKEASNESISKKGERK